MSAKTIREQILNANDIKIEIMNIPEWGVDIEIRALTGKKRAQIMSLAMDSKGKMDFAKMYAELVICACYDIETKELIFEPTDAEVLGEKSGGVIERIAEKVISLSGLKPDAVEVAEKN